MENIDQKDKMGCTPLHYAAIYGQMEAFMKLVTWKANWRIKSDVGKSVLHYASEHGQLSLVQMLLSERGVFSMINDADMNGIYFVE
jgi:ankyrin repeat protein